MNRSVWASPSRHRSIGLALVLLLSQAGGPAQARKKDKAEAGKADKAGKGKKGLGDEAMAQRQRGLQALVSKDFAGAYNALSESYRLSPEAETLYLLGQLAWQTGKTVAAQDLMRRFVADPASEKDAAARAEAERILEQPRPPSGEVMVLGERGSLLYVDDRVVGMLPISRPLLLGAGEHKVTLELNQRRLEGPVKVLPGRTAELRFTLGSDAVVARIVPALVWVPTWRGVPPAAEKALVTSIEQAVSRQRMSVVSKAIALAQAPKLAECLDTLPCLDQLATTNEADYVLTSSVEASGDLVRGDWKIRLGLVEATTGDYAATVEQPCDKCTADQVGAALDQALTKLMDKGAGRPRGQLEILSEPPGADVLTTDRKLGQTPYQRAAFAGRYEVSIKLKGYGVQREPVVVEEGKKATLRVQLRSEDAPPLPRVVAPLPPPPPPPPPPVIAKPEPSVRGPRPVWRIATGATLLGVGAILAGFGVSGLAQAGACSSGPEGCAMRFDTSTIGGALVGVGAAAALGGAVLIAIPGPMQSPSVKTAFGGVPGGGLVVLQGAF